MANIPNGVILGYIKCPNSGKTHDIAFHGHPAELLTVASILGLEPDPEQMELLSSGGMEPGTPLRLSSDDGFATLQPVGEASDFILHTARNRHDQRND